MRSWLDVAGNYGEANIGECHWYNLQATRLAGPSWEWNYGE